MSSYRNEKLKESGLYDDPVIDDNLFDEYEDEKDRDYVTEDELNDLGLGDAYNDNSWD